MVYMAKTPQGFAGSPVEGIKRAVHVVRPNSRILRGVIIHLPLITFLELRFLTVPRHFLCLLDLRGGHL